MKIAFPIQEAQGLESLVYNHFGSARFFVIVDAESGEFETVGNQDLHHRHGMCQPLAALNGRAVDAVVVGGIGAGALMKLNSAGVRVFRALEGTVSENLKVIREGKLPEFGQQDTCVGHHGGGGCAH